MAAQANLEWQIQQHDTILAKTRSLVIDTSSHLFGGAGRVGGAKSCKIAHRYERCCFNIKRAFPAFSESLKGVIKKIFSGASLQDRLFYLPPFLSKFLSHSIVNSSFVLHSSYA